MPRFAILIHDHPFVHWDLLVEQGEVLRSWRLLESPARWVLATTDSATTHAVLSAESIPDHRLMYLDYEGPVSRERGSVVHWDGGSCEWLELNEKTARVRLFGSRLCGNLTLILNPNSLLWTARFSLES